MACWLAEDDVKALAYVALGEGGDADLSEEQIAAADDAVQMASTILQGLTGGRVHGPGIGVDTFNVSPNSVRLRLVHQPVRKILSIERVADCETTVLDSDNCRWFLNNGAVYFSPTRRTPYSDWERRYGLPCRSSMTVLNIRYLFGSTISPAARNAMLHLARQLFLAGPLGDPDECTLPERVTSITREGLSIAMLDPGNYFEKGRIGVPLVDQWLSSMLISGKRNAALFSIDAPPGVNISFECRPAKVVV